MKESLSPNLEPFPDEESSYSANKDFSLNHTGTEYGEQRYNSESHEAQGEIVGDGVWLQHPPTPSSPSSPTLPAPRIHHLFNIYSTETTFPRMTWENKVGRVQHKQYS